MASKTVKVKIAREGNMCYVPVPFDAKEVFGKVRAPVKVTVNGHTYRSTIAPMGGELCIPLRKSNREAAGLEGGETVDVRIESDTETREVKPPADLMRALKAAPPAWERWQEMSFTHQREYAESVEEAKKAETRVRRVESAVRAIAARPARRRSKRGPFTTETQRTQRTQRTLGTLPLCPLCLCGERPPLGLTRTRDIIAPRGGHG